MTKKNYEIEFSIACSNHGRFIVKANDKEEAEEIGYSELFEHLIEWIHLDESPNIRVSELD